MTATERAAVDQHRAAIQKRLQLARLRLADLTELGESIRQAAINSNADDEHDPEGATIAWERAQAHSLVEAALADIAALARASDRLDAGWEGECARCGETIAVARLLARPATTCCLSCASSR